jgi:RNA polymerase subunit RPABC4/transcription elongation factor Spt4
MSKYCYACGTVTSGKPFFCSSCGRSYDVKLCPRRHVNPRFVEICPQCGSRDLSTPQPKIPLHWKMLAFALRILFSILLVLVILAVIGEALRTQVGQAFFLLLVLVLGTLCALWFMLPHWFRTFIHWLLKRREHHDEE